MPDRLAGLDLERITDAEAREWLRRLVNLVEDLAAESRELRAENQRLRDENNRLRGEQGQPTIRPQTPKPMPRDVSSEGERRQPRTWTKGKKRDSPRIDREEVLAVDPAVLPPDAEFKGYEDVDDAPRFKGLTEDLALCYLHDRITAAGQIPPLAQIIDERAQHLRLGASWGLT